MYSIIIAIMVTGSLLAMRMITSAEQQTYAYYAAARAWQKYWPFPRGKGLPRVVRPVLKPIVPIWMEVGPGSKMHLNPSDLISRIILETGVWDEDTSCAIMRNLNEGATFLDVGAHEGYCSLLAAPVVGRSGQVIAMEPNPELTRTLEANVRKSGYDMVTVEQVACWSSETVLNLFAATQSNTGSSSVSEANAATYGAPGNSYQVRGRPLDDIVKEKKLRRVDVIKIDVEGAELQALKGCRLTLLQFHPILLVELDDLLLKSMKTSVAEVIDFLGSCGYKQTGSYDDANFEFRPAITSQ